MVLKGLIQRALSAMQVQGVLFLPGRASMLVRCAGRLQLRDVRVILRRKLRILTLWDVQMPQL